MSQPALATQWPPLVTGTRLPRWVTVRDTVLTALAWVLLGALLRDTIHLMYDCLLHPVFESMIPEYPDWGELWLRLGSFVMISAVLVIWLCLWALIGWRRLSAVETTIQPPALTIAEQAARAGLDDKSVSNARGFKVTNVQFRADGTIAGFEEVTREVV